MFGSHWGPNGNPFWVPNLIFWVSFFEVIFGTDSAVILGGAGGRGGACLNLQILQDPVKWFSTPCTPAGSGGLSKGFAQGDPQIIGDPGGTPR